MSTNEFSWKKFQFVMTVQTALIANAVNLTLEPGAKEKRHLFSATGILGHMADAFYAADKIPDDLDAVIAADQFVHFILDHEGAVLEDWFARS